LQLPHPSWLPERVWPFHTYELETRDDVLAVTETGTGPALLLVHVGAWSFVWRDLMTRLAPDFRCITFDAPGNGRTRSRNSPVTLERASRAVASVIDALDLRDVTLAFHDLGGPAALAAVADMPQRVRGMVAVNTFAWKPDRSGLRTMLTVVGSRAMREFNVLTKMIPRISSTSFGVGRHLDQASRAAFLAGMSPRGIRAFHDYMHDALRCDGLYGTVARALAGPLAKLPMLTIFGQRNDPFGFQKRWKQLFPDASELVILKGNHFPMCDAPDVVARAIREWYAQMKNPAIAGGA
jgi:haloalkane dehalogenase